MPDSTAAYDPNYCTDWSDASDCVQTAATWANAGRFQLKYSTGSPGTGRRDKTIAFGAPTASIGGDDNDAMAYWDASGHEILSTGYQSGNQLTETGVGGSLRTTVTLNGNAVAFTWSSPLLQGLNLTQVTAAPASSNQGFDATFLPVNFYFPGYAPSAPKPAPITVPTGAYGPQVKPHIGVYTGDGSALLGGRTGHQVTGGPHRRSNFGRLNWTSYTQTDAWATGVNWAKFGPGPMSADRFHIDEKAKLHVYRPVNGVFTRMTVRGVAHRTLNFNAVHSGDSWYWQWH